MRATADPADILAKFFRLAGTVVGAPDAPVITVYRERFARATTPTEYIALAVEFAGELMKQYPSAMTLAATPEDLARDFRLADPSNRQMGAELFTWLGQLSGALVSRIGAPASIAAVGVASAQSLESAFVAAVQVMLDVYEHCFFADTGQADALIKKAALRHRPRRAVDVGAGAGYFTFYLVELGCHVTALELNPVKQDFLRFRAETRGVTARVGFGVDGRYDAVFAVNVFDHLADASELVGQIEGWLEPSGLLFYQAQFPDDGYHTSDPAVIARVEAALARSFDMIETSQAPGIGFEVLRRRVAPRGEHPPLSADPSSRPALHPAVGIDWVSPDECVAHSPIFYMRPVRLPRRAADLLPLLDGRRTLAQVQAELGGDGADLWSILTALDRHRMLVNPA